MPPLRSTARRRTLALVLGVVVPVLLLGLGWLASSLREREGLEREQRMLLTRSAEMVRGAVDESLEELRRREDARPFYLYNYYYSPPDVLALSDPVAVSPLAAEPDDRRVIGYFQVDPGGAVRTPYEPAAGDRVRARASRVTAIVGHPELEPIRALAFLQPGAVNSFTPRIPIASSIRPVAPDAGRTPVAAAPVRRARPRATGNGIRPSAGSTAGAPLAAAGPTATAPDGGSLAPSGPLTVTLNDYGNQVYNDLSQAQQGDPEANLRVQQRGRAAPITRRSAVAWEEVEERQATSQQWYGSQRSGPASTAGRRVPQRSQPVPQQAQPQAVPQAPPPQAVAPPEPPPTEPARTRPASRARARARDRILGADTATLAAARGPAPSPSTVTAEALLPQQATDVEYTSMAYRRAGDALVLHRVVSHGGAASVQGVVLDRGYLVRTWLPEVIRRHTVAVGAPRVVERGEGTCAVREPASAAIAGVELCFPPEALARATAELDGPLHLQSGLLAILVLVAAAAVFVVHRAGRRADELNAQKSAFVSAVSHELRTPLTTIRMHSEMLREGMVDDDKRDRFYEDLVQESVRLARLVENVLEISRLEEGRRPLRTVRADLVDHVRGVVDAQARLVGAKGFTLRGPHAEESLPVRFDAPAVEQIVVNLIDNAVKYARGAGERIIDVDVRREGPSAVIEVADRGAGIPAGERERVFERFYRVERQETAHMPGTGLGLALVRELARAHGGDATVGDREGGGCSIRVTLPLDTAPASGPRA